MEGRLVFFSGIYDTLDLYTEKFMEIFQKKGYQCLNLNISDLPSAVAKLGAFMEEQAVTAAIGFNGMGFNLELLDGHNFWEEAGIPVLNILMDHPFHFDKHLKKAPSTGIVLCMDRRHIKYIRRFYPHIRHVDFLPHAGIEYGLHHPLITDREIEVLYAGTLSRFVAEGLVPDLSETVGYDGLKLSKEVLTELTTHPEKTTEEAIEDYFLAEGIRYSDEELRRQITKLRFLDSFAVSFYREQAVRRLVESGIHVTVYGAGWDSCEWAGQANFDFRGRVLASRIPEVMDHTRIVLNTMTWFKAGTHDRVFNGMLQRAGVATDDSDYMKERFTSGRELYMFSLERIEEMPEKIGYYLSHTRELQEMADRGRSAARAHDTWENRIDEVVMKWIRRDG